VLQAYAATVRPLAAMMAPIAEQIEPELTERPNGSKRMDRGQVAARGVVLISRMLGELGDDPDRCAGPKARKNYVGTSPVTIASGSGSPVNVHHVRNTRLIDALMHQAMAAQAGHPAHVLTSAIAWGHHTAASAA
jgi:hypothetical protein